MLTYGPTRRSRTTGLAPLLQWNGNAALPLQQAATLTLTLYGHIKTTEQLTIIQQYSDWVHWPLMGGLLHLVQ